MFTRASRVFETRTIINVTVNNGISTITINSKLSYFVLFDKNVNNCIQPGNVYRAYSQFTFNFRFVCFNNFFFLIIIMINAVKIFISAI